MAITMKIGLNAPGMTSLHKVGLAGLYLTLRSFEINKIAIEGLKWELESRQVILSWHRIPHRRRRWRI